MPQFQTSSERLKVIIQTYWMENKELKMKLDNFKKKNITLHEVILGGAAKISTIISTWCYISPHEHWYWCLQIYEELKISVNSIIEATQFLLYHQGKYVLAEHFYQDPYENYLYFRQTSLGFFQLFLHVRF